MGSPYFVHKHVNRTHVVRSFDGFNKILEVIARSMGTTTSTVIEALCLDNWSPEGVVFNDLLQAYNEACSSRSRVTLFLEARYEWTGWEKFQRVIVFDFSGKVGYFSEGYRASFIDQYVVAVPLE